MPFENRQNQETSLETLVSQKFVCLCRTHLPAPLSLPLEGELVSQEMVYCLDGGLPEELTQGTRV